MARGGRRTGSGRKPKVSHLRVLDGGASHRSVAETNEVATIAIPEGVLPCPVYVTEPEAIAVWEELAPLAHEARTLTSGTARAFSMLCRLIPMELVFAASSRAGPEHRGLLQRINALQLQFCLTPNGKPLYAPKTEEKPKSGLSRFRSA